MTVTLKLSWPARPLWQNSNAHFMAKARAVKAARREAMIASQAVGLHRIKGVISAELAFEFYPPISSRATDIQNMPATVKAYIDGIADALGIDDKAFAQPDWPSAFNPKCRDGHVIVRVTPVYKARSAA